VLGILERRWDHRLVAIVAGPGFGKTTAVLDAVAATPASAGRDIWLSCEPGDTHALSIARAIGGAIEAAVPETDDPATLARHFADAIWSRAPEQICIVFDDLHEIDPDSSGAQLVTQLLAVMPTNAHFVCTARVMPNVGAVRMVAQGVALVIREDQLRFSEEEVAEFARLRGIDASLLAASEGWPALAELSVSASGASGIDFVWEQILANLSPERQRHLLELAVLGEADSGLLSAVSGVAVSVAEVTADLPMVLRRDDHVRLHAVWSDALMTNSTTDEIDDIRRRGAAHHLATGRFDAALRLFADARDWNGVIATLRAAMIDRFSPLDFTVIVEWSNRLPPDLGDEPVIQLVRGIAAATTDTMEAFTRIERSIAGFRERGDIQGELAATARLGRVANNVGDVARVLPALGRLEELAATGERAAADLLALAHALTAQFQGNPTAVVEILAPLVRNPGRDPFGGSAYWFYGRALSAIGRNREVAILLADLTPELRAATPEGFEALELQVLLALGDVASAEARLDDIVRRVPTGQSAYNVHFGLLNCATAFVLIGRADDARRLKSRATSNFSERAMPEGRLAESVRTVDALLHIIDGNEARAAELLPEFRPGVGYAAFETVWYVLHRDIRESIDSVEPTEELRWRREFTRCFVAARERDDLTGMHSIVWGSEGSLRTTALEPWIVEAACYAQAAGNPMPESWYDRLLPRYRHVLQSLMQSSIPALREAATSHHQATSIEADDVMLCLFGPMRLMSSDTTRPSPELRRDRVRALLGRLATSERTTRADVAAGLWPDLEPEKAAANLRVTLSYALRAFEPGREANAPSPYIGRHGTTIRLTSAVRVDTREFESRIAAGQRAESTNEVATAVEHYRAACDLYEGEFLADVHGDETIELERIRYRSTFVRVALRAAELLIAGSNAAAAGALASRVLLCDRWNEQAYLIAATAHLDQGATNAAREILDTGRLALAEIGIDDPRSFAILDTRLRRDTRTAATP
jgi:DNA-binding SARP family transcriptional activator